MRRLLLPLLLTVLACGGNGIPGYTPTPLSPAATVSAPQTESQPQASPATLPPTEAVIENAQQFPDPTAYEWKPLVEGLKRPVDVQSAQDGSGRLFIVEKQGIIYIFKDGKLLEKPFINIKNRVNNKFNDTGLVGVTFHPDFKNNGYFYVNYTGKGGITHISRFHANGNIADPDSEKLLMLIKQPYPIHNGGSIEFGSDGYLYIAMGDGGATDGTVPGDLFKNGQNTDVLLGKILRIDVNNGDPYSIPADNPFGNEVWAYGLRNPWRFSFDRATGDLWIGDVGQNQYEEINYLPAGTPGGANFGWSIMEGNHGYYGEAQPGLLLPVVEYSHDHGCSVIGGYVYRGSMPEWNGVYLYGDYCSGSVSGLILVDGQWQSRVLFEAVATITSFGEDEAGELYFSSDSGSIYILARK